MKHCFIIERLPHQTPAEFAAAISQLHRAPRFLANWREKASITMLTTNKAVIMVDNPSQNLNTHTMTRLGTLCREGHIGGIQHRLQPSSATTAGECLNLDDFRTPPTSQSSRA